MKKIFYVNFGVYIDHKTWKKHISSVFKNVSVFLFQIINLFYARIPYVHCKEWLVLWFADH